MTEDGQKKLSQYTSRIKVDYKNIINVIFKKYKNRICYFEFTMHRNIIKTHTQILTKLHSEKIIVH